MAKIYGLFGSMTGKLADTVMSVRNGEQIARKYQPMVFNPSTQAQIAQRAKIKLLSQLGAVMGPYIAIRKQGAVSSRNLFTKKNFRLATFATDTASIAIDGIQLTDSVVGLPNVIGTRDAGNFHVALSPSEASVDVDRVVYVMFIKQANNTLRAAGSHVVSEPGDTHNFFTRFPLVPEEVVIYAYGIRDNSENARITFGNMQVVSAETVAKLLTTSALTETDITLTETKAVSIPAVSRDIEPDEGKNSTKKK